MNWNGWLDTVECLESLLRCGYPKQHIIVCDNASQDDSFTRLQEWADGSLEVTTEHSDGEHSWRYRPHPKPIAYAVYDSLQSALAAPRPGAQSITFIQTGSNLGYGAGNNVGIRYALERLDARYVWLLNNDTVVDKNALHSQVRHAEERERSAIVGSRLLQYYAPTRIQALGGGMFYPAIAYDTQMYRGREDGAFAQAPFDLEHIVGASMLVRVAAMREVGLLDESYFLYREETDWCIRMRHQGWKLSYCGQSIVWHKEHRSAGFKRLLHDYYAVRNMLYLVQKFYPRLLATAFLTSLCLVMLPKIARLQFRRIATARRAYVDFFRGIRGKSCVNPDELIRRALAGSKGYRESPRAPGAALAEKISPRT